MVDRTDDLFTCRTRRQGPEAGFRCFSRSRSQDSLTCLASRQGSKLWAIPPAAAGQRLPDLPSVCLSAKSRPSN